jgi:hypothetical protein
MTLLFCIPLMLIEGLEVERDTSATMSIFCMTLSVKSAASVHLVTLTDWKSLLGDYDSKTPAPSNLRERVYQLGVVVSR